MQETDTGQRRESVGCEFCGGDAGEEGWLREGYLVEVLLELGFES